MSTSSKEVAGTDSAPAATPRGRASVLDFGQPGSETESPPVQEAGAGEVDLEEILSVGETAYRWDFKSDRIDWAPNAAAVLGVADMEKIARGRAFALLVDPEQASRVPAKGAFLLAGVNDLTLVNETYGYDVGDEVITIVGRRIGRALRAKDCIGRFSSNKFGIVLTDCSEEGLEGIARGLMATIRDHVIDTSVGAVAASISVGACCCPITSATRKLRSAGRSRRSIARAAAAAIAWDSISPASAGSRSGAAPWPSRTTSSARSTTGA